MSFSVKGRNLIFLGLEWGGGLFVINQDNEDLITLVLRSLVL